MRLEKLHGSCDLGFESVTYDSITQLNDLVPNKKYERERFHLYLVI